jgi:hypothetical protein
MSILCRIFGHRWSKHAFEARDEKVYELCTRNHCHWTREVYFHDYS